MTMSIQYKIHFLPPFVPMQYNTNTTHDTTRTKTTQYIMQYSSTTPCNAQNHTHLYFIIVYHTILHLAFIDFLIVYQYTKHKARHCGASALFRRGGEHSGPPWIHTTAPLLRVKKKTFPIASKKKHPDPMP